ncbi:MAG: nucleoside hydrolase [Melioribacteraceae bacterium]|nr:nucleoside hydrolase [Melioribacteraceae bacterium]
MKKYLILFFVLSAISIFAQSNKFIIDADTGNEMDDLYAVVRALENEKIDVLGLTSAHFLNVQLLTTKKWNTYPTENINTVKISQELNEEILKYLGKENIPHPLGCEAIVGYSWGYYEGAPIPKSPAVDFIIEQAKQFTENNKLNIVCLGAVTNVSAAILLEPSIAKNIRLYILSMDLTEKGIWNKNTFNSKNDINALDLLLDNIDLDLYIIPGNVSGTLVFNREKSLKILNQNKTDLNILLAKRWDEVFAGDTWVMWDLALIEVIINPDLASVTIMKTPPENTERNVSVYTEINAAQIEKNFWKCLSNLK